MADQERFMEPEKVRRISQGLGEMAGVLGKVNQALDAAMKLLQASAFIGNVGQAAVTNYLAALQPQIAELQKFCDSLSQFTANSVKLWEQAQLANGAGGGTGA